MKRILLTALALVALGCCTCRTAQAQIVDLDFDLNLYPDYYLDTDHDIYRYGFNLNNYAYRYEDRFVAQVSREYGISRSTIRRFLNEGFSPSDILFGAELSARTGHRFASVMNLYYNTASHNWIDISIGLGVPYGSPRFNLILGSFNRYYRDWGGYYYRRHPNRPPPMYHHGWSYFRPSDRPHSRPQGYDRREVLPDRPARPIDSNVRRGSSSAPSGAAASGARPESRPQATPERTTTRPGAPSQPNASGARRGSSGSSGSSASSSRSGSSRSSGSTRSSGSSSSSRSSSSRGSSGSRR